MSTWNHYCNSDFRNEGWGFHGSGVNHCWDAWSSIGDDSRWCSNPGNKGRGCVKFPVDIPSGDIPDGSVIESVTVFIRVAKTDGSSRSVTVNVLCSDDTSHFTQRTIYPTQTITTYEVATYTQDCLGFPWTKDRLNKLMVQVFSYCGVAGKINVYEVYAVINYRKKPVVTVIDPSGTVISSSPAVSWSYTQSDGDPQKSAEYKIYTADQQEQAAFNPDTSPALYPQSQQYTVKSGDSLYQIAAAVMGDGNRWPEIYLASNLTTTEIQPGQVLTIPGVAFVEGDITSLTALPFALAQNDYYIYVRATSTHNASSDWASRTFTVAGAAPGVPGGGVGNLGGIGTGGGGGFESVIADPVASSVQVSLRDGSNLLGAQSSDFETLTDSLGYTATNCTIVQDTTVNYGTGGASMSLTSGTGTMSAESYWVDVSPSVAFTARAQFRADTTGRTCNLNVKWFDQTFAELTPDVTKSGTGTDVVGSWVEVSCTGTVPSGAVYAQVQVQVTGTALNEVHNVDHIGLMYGSSAAWSNGGHTSRNLLSSEAATADDPVSGEPYTAGTATSYSRVGTSGVGSDGLKAFKMLYAGVSPTISFVATGSPYFDSSAGTGYTLNKPAGVADGDLLVAYVASDGAGTAVPPDGWVPVDSVSLVDGSDIGTSALTVMMRDGLAADPSTWVGNMPVSGGRRRAAVVAYRGAASTATQFAQENVSSSTGGSLVPTTAAVNNSDPGAWRLSAFAVADNVSGGSMTANIVPPTIAPNIQYVGRAGAWINENANTSYTINRPSGVVSGDLMIATVALSGDVTVYAPSGWSLVRTIRYESYPYDDHSGSLTMTVLKRTAGASEPNSWTGTHTSDGRPKISQCVAYRNAADASEQFIAEDGDADSNYNFDTLSVYNTDSRAWRVCAFAAESDSGGSLSSNETSERCDDRTSLSGFPDINLAMYDSNETISTGYTYRSATSSNRNLYSAGAWIGIIKPLSSAPPQGGNETERQDGTVGASNPFIGLSVYDSGGVAATGSTTVYGSYSPGSGSSVTSSCAWLGFLTPAAATRAGEASVDLVDYVDISSISSDVTNRIGSQVTVQAAFLGSVASVPHLKLYAYVGNELISTQVAEGAGFGTSSWQKFATQFVLPAGATRLKMGMSALNLSVNDYVLFDRVSMALGSSTVWRPGTGSSTHPVFDVPEIEYAEDLGSGYSDWAALPGTSKYFLTYDNLTGLCNFSDNTIIPLSRRKYRARTVSYGLAGDRFVSGFGPESDEVTLNAQDWWLKDIDVPDNSLQLKKVVQSTSSGSSSQLNIATTDTSAVFQPLGASRPIVVTEGYKGDVITISAFLDRFEYAKLRSLLDARRTLYLQSNIDNAWWVRPNGNITAAIQPTGKMLTDPLRCVTMTFVEVKPEG